MRVYLDNAATTPVLPEVVAAMRQVLEQDYGNPSGVYQQARHAKAIYDKARQSVAGLINAEEDEIYFTSGGTESDNWAIIGAALRMRDKGRHIITTAIEHEAVLNCCKYMEGLGWRVDYLPVDEYGRVDPDNVAAAIQPDTALVSVMLANNEIGTLQPIGEIASICREAGVLLHTDAVQAVGSVLVDVHALGVDMLSLSAHKLYGPKGVGVLYIRRGVRIDSLLHGGHQQGGRRPGTENMPGIAGLGAAAELASRDLRSNAKRISALREWLISGLMDIPNIRLNGHPTDRLPGNVNLCFAGVQSEPLLMQLDMAGIAASAGSACTSGSVQPSHVLQAIGVEEGMISGALRLTLGRLTTEADIEYALSTLPGIIERLRCFAIGDCV